MDKFERWDKEIDPRIDSLNQQGFFLEAFYLSAATVEHLLQNLIGHQEYFINDLIRKNGLKVKKTENLEDKTLGQLIVLFEKNCTDDGLILKLKEFNKFRIKIIHKLMDYSLHSLNIEAQNKQVAYLDLVVKLSRYGFKITKKLVSKAKRERDKEFKKSRNKSI